MGREERAGTIIMPQKTEQILIEIVNGGQIRMQSSIADPLRAVGVLSMARAAIEKQMVGGDTSHIVGAHVVPRV